MITKSGFEFELDKSALDNMELIDAIGEMESSPTAMGKVVTLLLGADSRRRLYDHCRQPNGRVPVEKVSEEIAEIFKLIDDDIKKS